MRARPSRFRSTTTSLRSSNGRDSVLATIRANWCSAADHRNVICETRTYGTEGVIFINPAAKWRQIVVYSPERAIPGATKVEYNGMSDCYEPALGSWHGDSVIMHYFVEQIRGGGADARTNALRQRHVIEIIDKLYAASLSGTAYETRDRLKIFVEDGAARRPRSGPRRRRDCSRRRPRRPSASAQQATALADREAGLDFARRRRRRRNRPRLFRPRSVRTITVVKSCPRPTRSEVRTASQLVSRV